MNGAERGDLEMSEFLLFSGETSTPNTGPDFDHTSRNASGHYLLLEGSLSKGNTQIKSLIIFGKNVHFFRDIISWYGCSDTITGN